MRSLFELPIALSAAAALLTSACHSAAPELQPMSAQALEVRNRSSFDVNVYALQSSLASRIRLGSVTGFSTAMFPLPRGAIRPDGSLTLYLRAIGSRRSWISPSLSLSTGLRACLYVYSTMSGDLSASSLFSVIAEDSSAAHRLQCSTRADTTGQSDLRTVR